jgi:hypothetical protein
MITALNWLFSFNCHLFNSLVLLALVVMLRQIQQKLKFVSTVVTTLVLLCSNILLAPVLLRSNLLLVTMEKKSTSRCIATNICQISLMCDIYIWGTHSWCYAVYLLSTLCVCVCACACLWWVGGGSHYSSGCGTMYKPEGRRFKTRWDEWIFSIYLILPAALGPGVYSTSNRNEYPQAEKCFWGVELDVA